MRHLLLLASVLAACANETEPRECSIVLGDEQAHEFYELCSGETPSGLAFSSTLVTGTPLGPDPRNYTFNHLPAIALGGTMELTVAMDDGSDFDLPYRVRTAGHVSVTDDDATLTLTGDADAYEWVALFEADSDLLFDYVSVNVMPVWKISLVSGTNEASDYDTAVAFTAGTRRIGIALWGDLAGVVQERLVDLGMTISSPGSQRLAWDVVELAPDATSVTVAAAAGVPETLTVTTATADRVDVLASSASNLDYHTVHSTVRVCFGAFAGTTQVLGHTWALTVDGEAHTPDGPQNCTSFVRESVGTVAITASAGGFTTSVDVYVETDMRGREF